jgi:hypothetical protein
MKSSIKDYEKSVIHCGVSCNVGSIVVDIRCRDTLYGYARIRSVELVNSGL